MHSTWRTQKNVLLRGQLGMDWHAWCHSTKTFLKMQLHDILGKAASFGACHHAELHGNCAYKKIL